MSQQEKSREAFPVVARLGTPHPWQRYGLDGLMCLLCLCLQWFCEWWGTAGAQHEVIDSCRGTRPWAPAHPRWGCTGACGPSPCRDHTWTLGDDLFPSFCCFPRKIGLWLVKLIPLLIQMISFHCIPKAKPMCWHGWELIQNTFLHCLSPLRTFGEEP